MGRHVNHHGRPGKPDEGVRSGPVRRPVASLILILTITVFIATSGCMGMLKIKDASENNTVNRTALLQQLIAESGEDVPLLAATPAAVPVELVQVHNAPSDALQLRQEYIYGDREHEMHAMVYKITVLPFYFWWFIDYNKFVVEQPGEGKQFLVVFLRFENHGTKSALLPSAEFLPVMYNDTIYLHRPYFNLSALSDYQKKIYGGTNENIRLPYQWIRELGQDRRDYAYLSGYNAIDSGGSSDDNSTATTSTSANTSTFSSVTRCTGSITVPADSWMMISQDISAGQCPGFFIKPGESNAIDGYLIYEVPQEINLKRTYVYGLFNTYSWTRWRLG